jgi:glycine/serine hydroxymethyltransferase
MGYANRGTVYRIVQEALKAQQVTSIDEVRELEATRLDALQGAVWADAVGGSLQAVQTVLKIMDQRAKLLGLRLSATSHLVATASGSHSATYDFTTMSIVPL